MLFKGSETYTMNSCETIELFYNIRTDLDKLTYATYITKIISDVTTENQNSFNTLKLFLNTLYMISETDKDLLQKSQAKLSSKSVNDSKKIPLLLLHSIQYTS